MEIKLTIQEGAALVHIAAASKWLELYLKNSCDSYLTAQAAGNEFSITVPPAGTYDVRANAPVAFVVRDEATSSFFEECYWLEGHDLIGGNDEFGSPPVLTLPLSLF